MNYKVFYRKYRPESFKDIVGQDHITKTLKSAIINKKVAHAYIFSGPRGTGKTTTAKVFAKTLNCLKPSRGFACEKCENCINYLNSSDIIEIDAASNNGVDEIREINNNVKIMPSELSYKVYIIDEVHMLTTSAFNALLLTLEEPPKHVVFILATTNIESLPLTILSRCQRFDFNKITERVIKKEVTDICQKENINITNEAIEEIAFLADGSLRDALSLLDQASGLKEITLDAIINLVGNVSVKDTKELIKLLKEENSIGIIQILDNLKEKGIDNKLLVKYLINEIVKEIEKSIKADKIDIDLSNFKAIMMDLVDYLNKINIYVDPYDVLKVLLLSHINLKDVKSNVVIEEKTEETQVFEDPINEEACLKTIRINNCFALATKQEKTDSNRVWQGFIESLNNNYKGFVVDTEVALASDEIIVVKSNLKYNVDELNKKMDLINTNYSDYVKKQKKVVFITDKEWKSLSKEYIERLKIGEKYVVQDEQAAISELNKVVNNIFDQSKIEEDK